jgi:hypothetical protein
LPWNEFLIPLLAGYIFIHLFHLTKFRAQRHDGYRLLIESTICGAVLSIISWSSMHALHGTRAGTWIETWVRTAGIAYPFLGTAAGAVFLALVLALAGNLLIGAERAKSIMVRQDDNGFLRLFHRAATESRMVSVTLESKKVYIGYITRTPNLSPEQQFVGLLPLLSGYRDKDTLRLEITTNYAKVISSRPYDAQDFEVTFCLDAISSANLFEPNAYPLFGDVVTPSQQTSQAGTSHRELEPPGQDAPTATD